MVQGRHQYLLMGASCYAALGHSQAEYSAVSKTVSPVVKVSTPHYACKRQPGGAQTARCSLDSLWLAQQLDSNQHS